jgi:hypothetical protein
MSYNRYYVQYEHEKEETDSANVSGLEIFSLGQTRCSFVGPTFSTARPG